jgi:cytochrome c biogenesis protein
MNKTGNTNPTKDDPTKPANQPDFLDTILRSLSSVRLGIYLLIILVVISFAGTIIPQKPNTDPEKLQRMFAPPNLALLDNLGILDLFHAWWFKTLLMLLGLNIVFASMDRFSHAWRFIRRPARWLTETVIRAQHQKAEILISTSPDEAERIIIEQFKTHIGQPSVTEREGRKVLFSQRHVYSRLAAYGIHLSLLVIFAGGLIGLQFGYRGRITLDEGEIGSKVIVFDTTRSVTAAATEPRFTERDMPFALRLDKAEIVFNDPKEASLLRRDDIQNPGAVKNWYCTVSIFENGSPRGTHVVAVNQPLSYRGYRFFQSGFDFAEGFKEYSLLVRSKDPAGVSHGTSYKLHSGESFDLKESVNLKEADVVVTPVRAGIMPQADIPFVVVSVQGNDGKPPVQVPVFDESTTRQMKEGTDEKKFQEGLPAGVEMYLSSVVPRFQSTFQVSRDPGVDIVWAGCILLMGGLMVAFYFSHQRAWAMLIPAEHGTTVVLGGDANKNKGSFARKFEHLVQALSHPGVPTSKS